MAVEQQRLCRRNEKVGDMPSVLQQIASYLCLFCCTRCVYTPSNWKQSFCDGIESDFQSFSPLRSHLLLPTTCHLNLSAGEFISLLFVREELALPQAYAITWLRVNEISMLIPLINHIVAVRLLSSIVYPCVSTESENEKHIRHTCRVCNFKYEIIYVETVFSSALCATADCLCVCVCVCLRACARPVNVSFSFFLKASRNRQDTRRRLFSKLKHIFVGFTLAHFRKSWPELRNTLCTFSHNS
jgi:hypothetical protein